MAVRAMFPLGSVVLPGFAVPLQIFEPRYVALVDHVLADDRCFCTVLIERGSEVGGGDTRFGVGTLLEIGDHRPLPDGRHLLVAHGLHRVRVESWLTDDPYPRARVVDFPDEPDGSDAATRTGYAECVRSLRRLLAVATERGVAVAPATFDAPDDPAAGSYLLAALAPVGALDRQRLLETAGPLGRVELLRELIGDQGDLLGVDVRS